MVRSTRWDKHWQIALYLLLAGLQVCDWLAGQLTDEVKQLVGLAQR